MPRLTNALKHLLLASALLLSFVDATALAQAGPAQPMQKLPPELEAAIGESHEALRRILNGDPAGYAALFADRADITLGLRLNHSQNAMAVTSATPDRKLAASLS